MRHNMLADIAHELRTPLSILQGNIEAILDGALPPDEQNLSSLHQETQHLSRLVEDLRTLSLAESGRLHFDITDIDLGRLAEEVVGGFRPQLETKNIEVDLQILNGIPHVAGDRDRVIQILRNLIANACKYTPEGGRIALKIEASESMVTASVADTGPGIPEEDINRVFDRFYRLDASRTRRTGGTGLGLAIVKQLTESMGGQVWARSIHGKGSTFFFSLPRAGSPSSA
jgi:signal transduction histidine kinase